MKPGRILDLCWKFNAMDNTDKFNIAGAVKDFNAEKTTSFTKLYMNVTIKGIINLVQFNFVGNDIKASGNFAVDYDDLKFTVYKKDDAKKKNKLLTFVTNLFVKKVQRTT